MEWLIIKGLFILLGILKGNKYIMGIVKVIDHIDLEGNQHIATMGIARHGKTYSIKMSALKLDQAVIFFNTQHEEAKGYILFDPSKHSPLQFYSLVKNKRKINFIPSTVIDTMQKQLEWIVNAMYSENFQNLKVKLLLDETHLFKGKALEALKRIATTGNRWNKDAVFLTQRPANMENNLLTQSTRYIIFKLGEADYYYLKNQGFPVDRMRELTKEKYHFIEWDGSEIKGPYKIRG